jgi:eukaryotic-like serine/threonine-protein kinase
LPSWVATPGSVVADKYEIEHVLGAGGMGVVVAARHKRLGQRVAIKVLRTEATPDAKTAERFLREARASVALSSEHVARVLDVGTHESGAPYIVMEYLAGVDLGQIIQREGPMAVPAAVGTILQACEAIAEAHARGIVHRDLKPANLFVTSRMDGSALVKVLDFGISKATHALPEGGPSLTASGFVMGSPAYMSPEQVRSSKDVDARSDIWSLGVILYELVTGVSPFLGETLGDTFAKIATEKPPVILKLRPDVPRGLAAAIDQCLERSLATRTQSVAELAARLHAFAPKDAAIFVDRILRISSRSSSSTVTSAESPSGSLETGPQLGGTERPWLRSSTSSSNLPPQWRRLALVAGLMAVGPAGVGIWYALRSPATSPFSTSEAASSRVQAASAFPPGVAANPSGQPTLPKEEPALVPSSPPVDETQHPQEARPRPGARPASSSLAASATPSPRPPRGQTPRTAGKPEGQVSRPPSIPGTADYEHF